MTYLSYADLTAVFQQEASTAMEEARLLLGEANALLRVDPIEVLTAGECDADEVSFRAFFADTPADCVRVSLVLADGEEDGFEGPQGEHPAVAVQLVVHDPSGQELQNIIPYNRTPSLGVSDPLDLVERIQRHFSGATIAGVVGQHLLRALTLPRPDDMPKVGSSATSSHDAPSP